MIIGIFLAAGESRRFGSNKLLYEIGGEPLVCHGLNQCVASRLPEIRVVVGTNAPDVEAEIDRRFKNDLKIQIDRNEDPVRGMMSSLKTGLRQVDGRCDGAMVLLADMPLITAIMINDLIGAFEKHDAIVVPECGGELQHPRVIPKRLFPEFLELGDDQKGTTVIERHRGDIVRVSVGIELNYIDIDKPEDIDTLENF
jgi:molybdenum cofactor cytidylyltransferase